MMTQMRAMQDNEQIQELLAHISMPDVWRWRKEDSRIMPWVSSTDNGWVMVSFNKWERRRLGGGEEAEFD